MGAAAKMLLELNDADTAKCTLIGQRMKRHPGRGSTAICGTTETPVPADHCQNGSELAAFENDVGSRRARPQADSVLSRK